MRKDSTIAFASRTLLPSEKHYSQIKKEVLSLVFGVVNFTLTFMAEDLRG